MQKLAIIKYYYSAAKLVNWLESCSSSSSGARITLFETNSEFLLKTEIGLMSVVAVAIAEAVADRPRGTVPIRIGTLPSRTADFITFPKVVAITLI
jgi:hypothetical protein